ncbi:hypothetical protein F2Q70_00020591 [Brassica cretica]|uniref:Uncharacterized protein n=1 Tax=Brassica cretica TaxID=69181 RepID=A0A8S9GPC0_BRACR|nr:hypothetical protein F2Q70_00020591 [Brassica cretica]
MESTSRRGETYEEASKRDRRNSQGLMEAGGHVVLHTWKSDYVKNQRINRVTRSCLRGFRFTREEGKLLDVLHCSCTSLWRKDSRVRLRVTHKIRWWQAASIRKKDFGAVFDLQSQGVCDSHKACVIICIGVLGFFMFCKFGEGFHGVLESNLHGISFAGGVLIYVGISARWYSLVSVKDVAEGLKEIDSCGYVFGVTHSFLLELICENEELLVQGRVRLNRGRCQIEIDSGWKHVCFGFSAWDSVVVCFGFLGHMRGETNGSTWYHRAAVQSDVQGKVFIQIVTKEILRMMSSAGASSSVRESIWRSFVVNNNGVRNRGRNVHRGLSQCTRWFQVGEIMMRDLQGMQRYLQERGDSRYLKGKQTHNKSKLDLRRWNQRSSISQGLKVFQRSQGMQFKSGSWVHERNGFWLVEESQRSHQVRDFDSKLGSQLKTIDEGDGYSEWQWDCHIPSIRRDVYIMKEFQDWLKVELREVKRDKRRQGDAEDEQAC